MSTTWIKLISSTRVTHPIVNDMIVVCTFHPLHSFIHVIQFHLCGTSHLFQSLSCFFHATSVKIAKINPCVAISSCYVINAIMFIHMVLFQPCNHFHPCQNVQAFHYISSIWPNHSILSVSLNAILSQIDYHSNGASLAL